MIRKLSLILMIAFVVALVSACASTPQAVEKVETVEADNGGLPDEFQNIVGLERHNGI